VDAETRAENDAAEIAYDIAINTCEEANHLAVNVHSENDQESFEQAKLHAESVHHSVLHKMCVAEHNARISAAERICAKTQQAPMSDNSCYLTCARGDLFEYAYTFHIRASTEWQASPSSAPVSVFVQLESEAIFMFEVWRVSRQY
jgi:hypothetical protein